MRIRSHGLVLLAVICGVAAPASIAQPFVGIAAGPQVSSVKARFEGITPRDLHLEVGFHFGVAVGIDAGAFTIRTGVNYLNQGGLIKGNSVLDKKEYEINHFAIPVDLRLHLTRTGRVRPYVFAGPEFRYALNLKDDDLVLQEDLRLVTATFALGAGVSLRMPVIPIRFSPEVRYARDLNGVYEGEIVADDGGLLSTAGAIKANALRIGVVFGM